MARLIGINHVALEVGDVGEALEFYGSLFDITLRGRGPTMAFIDMGDQFIALSSGRTQPPDGARHFGLVVDDMDAVREALKDAGVDTIPARGLDFRDPWGNQFQVVDYREIQFERTPGVKRKLGIEAVEKSGSAKAEITDRGLA